MLNKKTPLKGVYESHTLCNNAIIIRLFKLSHLMFEFALYVLAFSLYLIRFVNQRLPILEKSIFIVSLAVIVCVIFNTFRLRQTGI